MARLNLNGKSYEGSNIKVKKEGVYIDGVLQPDTRPAPLQNISSEWLNTLLSELFLKGCKDEADYINSTGMRIRVPILGQIEDTKQAIEAHYATQLSNELIKARIDELEQLFIWQDNNSDPLSDSIPGLVIAKRMQKLKAQLNPTKEDV